MKKEAAETILALLKESFPGIDARVDVSKHPHFATATFFTEAHVIVYYENICILVLTSERQADGFIALAQMFSDNVKRQEQLKGGE